MGNCAPKGLKVFKDFVKIAEDEVMATIVWNHLDGDVDSLTTQEDVIKVYLEASEELLNNKPLAAELKEVTSTKPLAKFSFKQRNELVDNLMYLSFWDETENTIKPIEDVELEDLRTVLEYYRDLVDEGGERVFGDYEANYNEVLKEENLAALKSMVLTKMFQLGVDIDPDADPDNKLKEGGFTDAYLIKNLDRARVSSKLMVAFLAEKGKGSLLGLQKFNDFNASWNELENALSNVAPEEGVPDKMETFYKVLREASLIKPQYDDLITILENTTEAKRTQFLRSLDNVKIEYVSEVIRDSDSPGYDQDMLTSASQTNADKLLNLWGSNYIEAFTNIDKEGNPIANSSSAESTLHNYRVMSDRIKDSKEVTAALKQSTVNLLSEIGMSIDMRALEVYLNISEKSPMERLEGLYSLNGFGYVFTGSRASKNSIDKLAKGELESDQFSDIGNPITDEKNLKELADIQARFEVALSGNNVLGPDGKMYQMISQYDYISKKEVEIKSNNQYLNKLDNEYSKFSRYIPYLKDAKNKDKFKLVHFLSRRYEGKDAGLDMNGMSEVDEHSSRVERVLNGMIPYFTLADKNRVYYFNGLPTDTFRSSTLKDETVMQFVGYLADEFNSMRKAWEDVYGENPVPHDKHIENYHYKYKTDSEGNKVPDHSKGNAFKITLIPELSPGTDLSTELGLYNTSENNKPFTLAGSYVSEDANGDIRVEPGFVELVKSHVEAALEARVAQATDKMMEELITIEDGEVTHSSFSTKTYNTYIRPYATEKNFRPRDGVKIIATNYVVNTLAANIEFTKMFTGDPRMYKSLEDFSKRVPAGSATGDYLRIVKGEVNEHFKVAVSPNFNYQSEDLYGKEALKNIKEFVGDSKGVQEILEAYKNVNRTDAQAWITMSRFKEIQVGLGEWTEELETAYKDITNRSTKTKKKSYKVFSKKMSTMQPKKGMHYELIRDKHNNLVPVYLKYSQAILFPELISSSRQLTKISEAMEAQGVSELITGDGVKSGAIKETDLNADVITFNTIELSNSNWKLQQDLPSKGNKDTLVGSQIKKNILADIDLKADYDGMSGEELLENIHRMDRALSNKGYEKVLKKLGVENGVINKSKLYETLDEEFEAEGASKNLLESLKQKLPLDSLLSDRQTVYNKINSIFNKATVKIKQPGGSAIQLSDYGFESGADMVAYKDLKDKYKEGIVWLTNDRKLRPPRVVKEGDQVTMSVGQVLLPYNKLASLFGEDWDKIKTLPFNEIKDLIDPKALRMIGYRVPNQKLASNDSLEIVGILPPHAGDTIILYSEITAKTGSDFDIDKMYYILPALELSEDGRHIKVVEYNDELSEEENSEEALQTRRVDLYRKVLESPHSFKRVISSVDADWLKDLINDMLPKQDLNPLELFDGNYQMQIRREFITSKGGVGQVATHQSDHAISQGSMKFMRDPSERLDIGNKTKEGHLDLSQIYSAEGSFIITEAISAYMNAFVDAAKDNYIGRANFNFLTNNSAFLLIRNGVDPRFVTAFMAQPAIKRYVELTSIKEGQAVEANIAKPIDVVMNELGITDEEKEELKTSKLSHYTTEGLIKNVKEDTYLSGSLEQAKLLNLFLRTQDLSKSLGNSMMASKADTNGAGASLGQAYIIQNLKKNVSEEFNSEGELVTGNWENMFQGTMLGAYHENSVEAIIKLIGPLSTLGTSGMQFSMDETYKKIFGKLPDNFKKYNKLYQIAHASLLAEEGQFKEDMLPLFKGDDSVAKRILKLKNNPKYEHNSLIDILSVKIGRYDNLDYISINNAKGRDVRVNEGITADWLDLYYSSNEVDNKLAKDLAVYAFHTSALQDNLSSIYRLIPYQIGTELGISEDTLNNIKYTLNTQDKQAAFNDMFDKVLKNSWKDTSIVPKINKKNALKVGAFSSEEDKYHVFTVDDNNTPYLKVGRDINRDPIFKPYITRDRYINRRKHTYLYKYVGNTAQGNAVAGVYKRVSKSGESKGIYKLFEFTDTSIIKGNEYTAPADIKSKFDEISIVPPKELFLKGKTNSEGSLDKSEEIINFADIKANDGTFIFDIEGMTEDLWNELSEEEKEVIKKCK